MFSNDRTKNFQTRSFGGLGSHSERVRAALIETVEHLGFEASIESIEPREADYKLIFD